MVRPVDSTHKAAETTSTDSSDKTPTAQQILEVLRPPKPLQVGHNWAAYSHFAAYGPFLSASGI